MTHKLLLADDSVTIQRVIELTFADEDVEVITVGDGQLAIDRLDTDPPDIVLADVDMPKRDGYEVAAYVKSRPKLAHIPVVLLTGAFEPIDQARAAQAGSSDVLAKPFEPQMVINRVKQLLGRKREDERRDAPQVSAPSPPMRPPAAPRPPAPSSVAMNDEHATQQDQPPPTPGQTAEAPVSLDDYFDQLDAAFSNLQPGAPAIDVDTMRAEADWIDTQPEPIHAPPPPHPAPPGPPAPAQVRSALNPPAVALPPPVRPMAPRPQAPPSPQRHEPLITPPGPPAVKPSWAPQTPVAVSPPLAAPRPSAPPAQPRPAPPPLVAKPAPVAPPAPVPPAAKPLSVAPAAPATLVTPGAPVAPPAPAPPAAAPRPTANPFAELSAAKAEAAARPVAPAITNEVIEEVVTRVLQRLSDRVIRETVTEIVSKTAERLVQEEIQRIKVEGQ
jgi:CheY-like chemotaxis protein